MSSKRIPPAMALAALASMIGGTPMPATEPEVPRRKRVMDRVYAYPCACGKTDWEVSGSTATCRNCGETWSRNRSSKWFLTLEGTTEC